MCNALNHPAGCDCGFGPRSNVAVSPAVALRKIKIGLTLLKDFRDLASRFMGKSPPASEGNIDVLKHAVRIQYPEAEVEIGANDLALDEWDGRRYESLQRRLRTNWTLFNEIYASNVGLSADETARIHVRLEHIKSDLCRDFHEMVKIFENALGKRLPGHYSLFEVCGD